MSTKDFEDWISAKCPTDFWVYRGQAAKYNAILPSALRNSNRSLFANRLYDLDPRIADRVLRGSPLKGVSKAVTGQEIYFTHEGTQTYLRNDDSAKSISWSRFIRALGQHYGFPTFYIDLTLNPWVAAAFANMKTSMTGTETIDKGVVYRWPARRVNDYKLYIEDIEVIDLSRISPLFRRPTIQGSLLALPVKLPNLNFEEYGAPGAAQHFPVEPDALGFIDMINLKHCECFEINNANTLAHANIKDLCWLFPDSIDIGYSYMTAIALLSLIVVYPDEYEFYGEDNAQKLFDQYESSIKASQVILDRECFRLVPGIKKSSAMNTPLNNARHAIDFQVESAINAVENVGSLNQLKLASRVRRKIAREIFSRVSEDKLWFLDYQAPFDVRIEFKTGKMYVHPITEESKNTSWILPEIRRRHNLFNEIMDRAEKIPAFAIIAPSKYESFYEVFPTNNEYEREIKRTTTSQRKLNIYSELFPHDQEKTE